MATMAADPAFVDTNVLVYASQRRSAFHPRSIACLDQARRESRPLWISRQVMREYLVTVTRPQRDQASLLIGEAVADIEKFQCDFNIAEDGPEVFAALLDLLVHVPVAGKQVHDANLVATMRAYGISRLLTFNDADFRCFANLVELAVP
jgi:predicted nucleic acid-binding protein